MRRCKICAVSSAVTSNSNSLQIRVSCRFSECFCTLPSVRFPRSQLMCRSFTMEELLGESAEGAGEAAPAARRPPPKVSGGNPGGEHTARVGIPQGRSECGSDSVCYTEARSPGAKLLGKAVGGYTLHLQNGEAETKRNCTQGHTLSVDDKAAELTGPCSVLQAGPSRPQKWTLSAGRRLSHLGRRRNSKSTAFPNQLQLLLDSLMLTLQRLCPLTRNR